MASEAHKGITDFNETFELIFVKNRKMFEKIAYFQVGNEEEAKDIVSKCFMSLWEHRNEIRKDNILSYMFVSVRNACMDYRRSDSTHRKVYENILQKERDDLLDANLLKYTQSLDGVSSKMITLSFYFE